MESSVYKELLLEHYRNSPYRGTLAAPTFVGQEYNPSCGDRIAFQGVVLNDRIVQLAFTGQGCVISQAAASLLAHRCCQLTIKDVMVLDDQEIAHILGLQLGPTRLKCALLSLHALKKGLTECVKKHSM